MKTIKILFTLLMFTFINNVTAQEPNVVGRTMNLNNINGELTKHTIKYQLNDSFNLVNINYYVLIKQTGKALIKDMCTINFIGENIVIDNYIKDEIDVNRWLQINTMYLTDLDYLIVKCTSLESLSNNDNKKTYIILDMKSNFVTIMRDVCPDKELNKSCKPGIDDYYYVISKDIG